MTRDTAGPRWTTPRNCQQAISVHENKRKETKKKHPLSQHTRGRGGGGGAMFPTAAHSDTSPTHFIQHKEKLSPTHNRRSVRQTVCYYTYSSRDDCTVPPAPFATATATETEIQNLPETIFFTIPDQILLNSNHMTSSDQVKMQPTVSQIYVCLRLAGQEE